MMGNDSSALHYLKISVDNEQDLEIEEEAIGNFIGLIENPIWADIEAIWLKNVENIALAKQLLRMGIKDQAYYPHLHIAETQLGAKLSYLCSIMGS